MILKNGLFFARLWQINFSWGVRRGGWPPLDLLNFFLHRLPPKVILRQTFREKNKNDWNTIIARHSLRWSPLHDLSPYRFSAFWLRSKCSICSYQLNIWYAPHWGASILNWFLELGRDAGACSGSSAGWPGIAVPPGTAHYLFKPM